MSDLFQDFDSGKLGGPDTRSHVIPAQRGDMGRIPPQDPPDEEYLYVNPSGRVASVKPSPIGQTAIADRDEFSYEQLLALLVASLPNARRAVATDADGMVEVSVTEAEFMVTDKLVRLMDSMPRVTITRSRDHSFRGWRYVLRVESRL